MANLDIDYQNAQATNALNDPTIKPAISLSPLEHAIQGQATDVGAHTVTPNLGAVNADADSLGNLASIYQAQLAAGPGLMSQAAALQAERNTNAVGGLRSLAAGAQGEQATAAVGQGEANQNASGAIGFGNNAAMAKLQALQTQLQAHFDNLSNNLQGDNLSRNIGLAAKDRQNSLTAMQNNAAYQQQQTALGNQVSMNQYTQNMVGAGVNAVAGGLAAANSAFQSNPELDDVTAQIQQQDQGNNAIFAQWAQNKSNDALLSGSQSANSLTTAPLGSYDSPFGVSGAPNADTWALSSASSSFGLQSNYQSGVA